MKNIIVILDNIRSTFNVGSIFRSADGAGVKKVYLCGITPDPTHLKIKKTALGAENYVEWEHKNNINELITELKLNNYEIISVEQTNKAINYKDLILGDNTAFIFGNEISGVSPELIELSDKTIEIPMKGLKNSLNVSTTAGIILFSFN